MKIPRSLKKRLATAQTWFPFTRSKKFEAYNFLTRNFGRHVEPEFRLLADLRPIKLAVDVGGNWGQSIEAIRYYAKPGQIASFEPNPPLARRLLDLHQNDASVEIMPFGLGAEPGAMPLHTPIYGEFIFDGLTSFDRDEALNFLDADNMAWFNPAKLHLESNEVEVRTLDSFELKPDAIKLDVQGFEHQVLLGGKTTFASQRPFTILENPSDEVVDFFKDLEMSSFVLRDKVLHRGATSDHNTVFMTNDCAKRLIASGNWSQAG